MEPSRDNNLWSSIEISKIFKKEIKNDWLCNSVEIDSRKVQSGSIFLAMPGTKLDGHNFLLDVLELGVKTLVIKNLFETDIKNLNIIKVDDVYKSLIHLAKASRKRIKSSKNIIAITGSSGKTSTKEMIGKAFSAIGHTHINPGSYNNHVGVPYSLANMPKNTDYGIFELGMNNLNEISFLSKLVEPNIVIITNISEAHIGNFDSIKEIIRAKVEIFDGLKANGYILVNNDHLYYKSLKKYINNLNNINLITYGKNSDANIRLIKRIVNDSGQTIIAKAYGKKYKYSINMDGEHQAINSLAVIGALFITKCDIEKGLKNLSRASLPSGRGSRHNIIIKGKNSTLIDDTYNANPSSMIAALKSFNEIAESNRKILIFGEMGELGIFSEDLHQKVYNYLISLDISLVIFIGNKTQKLYKSCNNIIECSWSENVYNAVKDIKLELFQPEDCILVKGSRHMKLEILVKHLIYKFKGK